MVVLWGGAAGSRTPVQTGNQYGFYMHIRLLVVGIRLASGSRPEPYSLESSLWPRERTSNYPGLNGTPYTATNLEQITAGYLAPNHLGSGITLHPSNGLGSESKIIIAYCCLRSGLTSYISKLGMLTYPFYLLSIPNDPSITRVSCVGVSVVCKITKIIPERINLYIYPGRITLHTTSN